MGVNLDKPHLWKEDTQRSVDYYNKWFLRFAPKAYRETRVAVTAEVERAIVESGDLLRLSPKLLLANPDILRTLRMACCPPIAVERLAGLAYTTKSLVERLEEGKLPLRMSKSDLGKHLTKYRTFAKLKYWP